MEKTIFLSHNAKDKPLADIISSIFGEISIGQITPWFSSDNRVGGGFNAGDDWYAEILKKIKKCNVLIAIITPNSIDRPWVYYEAGIAKGLTKTVIPVCIGIKREDLKSPLNVSNAYQLTDKDSLEDFLGKTLELFGFPLDKRNFKKSIEKTIIDITKQNSGKSQTKSESIEEMLGNLKTHIDQKFTTFPAIHKKQKGKVANIDTYSIKFKLDFPSDKREFISEIDNTDTFQNIADSIYFNFQDVIKSFTYLEEWVIVDGKTENYLVLREITSRVPAKNIFLKDRVYFIKKLTKPYISTDSKERI